MKTDHLLFGAAYYSEYLPYDRVEKDMEMMEKAGMNTIRIAESTWSTIEPKDGIFDFTHLDKMLEAAARHHISVIVGTPTYAIPAWLAKKYPDILALTNNGQNIYGARQNMDITHAGYLFHCERVIRAMMEHIKDVPHIIGFQLDNETKSYGTAGLRVQAMFVDYLKEKYPDINEFNREFGLDYWSNRVNTWEDFPDVRGTINGSLGAEFEKYQRSLVEEFLGWQAAIVSEYKREDQFITHNLDFEWRGYSYGVQPDVTIVDLQQAVHGTLHLLRPLADQSGVTITCLMSEGVTVRASEDDIYHIVFNLVENAIKYNLPGGDVTVRVETHGGQSVLSVADTGIGIPEADRPNIFNRFYRVDKARSREHGGSGLGLSIVHDAAALYGGTVTVDGVEPHGTRFTVTFPRAAAGDAPETQKEVPET